MSSYLLFVVLGLGSGSVYAILGLGLVLKYRSAGVIDFAHGAIAMWVAYVFIGLRSTGTLYLPWWGPGHHLQVGSGSGMATPVALVVAVVYGTVLGGVLFRLVYLPLRKAPALARVGASAGLMLAFQALAVIDFGSTTQSTPPILPQWHLTLFGLAMPTDGLWLAGIALVIAGALAFVYRWTRFGLLTRAAAENETGAALIGISANRVAFRNWLIASALAGLAGILVLPLTTITPGTYTLFVVPALGVALVARFSSFAVTAIGGLVLGAMQSELTKLQTVWHWLPQQGTQDGLPFILIMVAMAVTGRSLVGRGALSSLRSPSIGRPSHPLVATVGTLAVAIFAVEVTSTLYREAILTSAITACICLSVVVLTGYVGQISLAQNALAGISAFTLSHISQQHGLDFPLSMILAALAAVVVGVVVGLPALRVRGVNLAVVTLAAASALDALVFSNTWFTGGYSGRAVTIPTVFGVNFAAPRTYAVTALVIVALLAFVVARLRSSDGGRVLIAVRSNERAAAAVGIDVARTKLFAFGFSAFVAGIGGALLAYQQVHINGDSFVVWSSLSILAITYVAGVGRISGAIVAGLLMATAGVMPTLLNQLFNFQQYQTLVAGIALVLTAIGNPDGVAKEMGAGFSKLGGLVSGRASRPLGLGGRRTAPAAGGEPRPTVPADLVGEVAR